MPARQREYQARASIATVFGMDVATMHLDDGAADGQSKADARYGAFLFSALEFLEDL